MQKFSCRHYLLIFILIILGLIILVELLSPYYFDSLIRVDGLLMAAKLGKEFEERPNSPYFRGDLAPKNQGSSFPEKASQRQSSLKVPHTVQKII